MSNNKFKKSLANIRKAATEQDSNQSSNRASKIAVNPNRKLTIDFSLDEQMESKDQVIVSFRTAPGNRKALRQAALDRDLSVADLLKNALEEYLNNS